MYDDMRKGEVYKTLRFRAHVRREIEEIARNNESVIYICFSWDCQELIIHH